MSATEGNTINQEHFRRIEQALQTINDANIKIVQLAERQKASSDKLENAIDGYKDLTKQVGELVIQIQSLLHHKESSSIFEQNTLEKLKQADIQIINLQKELIRKSEEDGYLSDEIANMNIKIKALSKSLRDLNEEINTYKTSAKTIKLVFVAIGTLILMVITLAVKLSDLYSMFSTK